MFFAFFSVKGSDFIFYLNREMTTELLQVSDIKFKFVNVSEVMEADLKKAVDHQIANKGQTILKKIYAKNIDAKVIIDYTIVKNKS